MIAWEHRDDMVYDQSDRFVVLVGPNFNLEQRWKRAPMILRLIIKWYWPN